MWIRNALAPALLALLISAPTQAQTFEVHAGVICDSQHDAERYVALFNGDVAATMKAVNDEAEDGAPCGVATVALIRGPEVGTIRTWSATFHIVEIFVVGIATDGAARKVEPTHAYSVDCVPEREA
jgi:hypothetical protein